MRFLIYILLGAFSNLAAQSTLPQSKPNPANAYLETEENHPSYDSQYLGELFYVSKIGPALPYTKARFDEIWKAFREQYYLKTDGKIIQTKWARSWVSQVGRNESRPSIYAPMDGAPPWRQQAKFSVVNGPGPDGYVEARISSVNQRPDNLDRDVRIKNPESGAVVRLYLSDRTAVCPPSFTSYYEYSYELSKESDRYLSFLQLSLIPNSKELQEEFMSSIKSGSQFRVVVSREVSCSECGGLGRPRNSNRLGTKCDACSGAGRVKKAEIKTLVW